MTREEAIEKLELMRQKVDEETYRALILAIKALEQNESAEKWYKLFVEKLDEQEPCDDAISREAVLKKQYRIDDSATLSTRDVVNVEDIEDEPSVNPQKSGKWIYDETIANWRCSKCNETPKTMGYVGTADFMAEHFKFCNHCGARMIN